MTDSPRRHYFYRHSLVVRVTHWVNLLCMIVLLMSGLQIFNAHPALYWGNASDFDNPTLAIGAMRREGAEPRGIVQVFGTDVRYDRRARSLSQRSRGDGVARLPLVDHHPELPGSRHRPALALLLRLDLRDQRSRLHRLHTGERALAAARSDWPPAPRHRRFDPRASVAALPEGRGGEDLQRAAKARLFLGHLRRRAASDPRRPDHVARPQRRLPLDGRAFRRAAVGAHHPFHRRLRHPRLRGRPCADGADLRRHQQHALDDHRPLPHRTRRSPMPRSRPDQPPRFSARRGGCRRARCCSAAAIASRRRRGSAACLVSTRS